MQEEPGLKEQRHPARAELAELGRLLAPEQGAAQKTLAGSHWKWAQGPGEEGIGSLGRYGKGRPHHLTLGCRKEGCCSHF